MQKKQILSGFATEIHDVNCEVISDAQMTRLIEILFENHLLVIKGQNISSGSYLAFMKKIGEPVLHVLQNHALPENPEIIKISSLVNENGTPEGVLDGGSYWHADMSYLHPLGIATALYCVRVSKVGGRTQFLDLADGLQKLENRRNEDCKRLNSLKTSLNDITIFHRFGNRRKRHDNNAKEQRLTRSQSGFLTEVTHKLIERHPITKQKSLFAIAGSAVAIEGVNETESDLILNEIEDFVIERAKFYEHQYETGDIVIWDNMSTLHQGFGVTPTTISEESRLLYRINVNYGGNLS